jgi:DNA polymerase III psi subunit
MNIESTEHQDSTNPSLLISDVSGSLSFKEQIVKDIIPFVERMIEKEKTHLYWLESKNAPKEFIERSKWHLNHFRQRHIEYADGL